ncbi:MAG: class II aldolase/adducin family protein [Thermaerobacter sp.]|nr:class II aldolase/adducin family protein [Thermaerobacter sp.]
MTRGTESGAPLVEAARQLVREGLVVGTAGNVSVRTSMGLIITPTAVPADELIPEQLAVLDDEGGQVGGTHRRSSEWRLHLAIYHARPDVGAVVHTHSVAATTLAVLRIPIPPIHYALHELGGEVRVAPYATFGSAELAQNTAATLGIAHAVLLANHGAVAVGPDLPTALERARLVEWLGRVYLEVLRTGSPHVLTPDEMAAAGDRFQDYRPSRM